MRDAVAECSAAFAAAGEHPATAKPDELSTSLLSSFGPPCPACTGSGPRKSSGSSGRSSGAMSADELRHEVKRRFSAGVPAIPSAEMLQRSTGSEASSRIPEDEPSVPFQSPLEASHSSLASRSGQSVGRIRWSIVANARRYQLTFDEFEKVADVAGAAAQLMRLGSALDSTASIRDGLRSEPSAETSLQAHVRAGAAAAAAAAATVDRTSQLRRPSSDVGVAIASCHTGRCSATSAPARPRPRRSPPAARACPPRAARPSPLAHRPLCPPPALPTASRCPRLLPPPHGRSRCRHHRRPRSSTGLVEPSVPGASHGVPPPATPGGTPGRGAFQSRKSV